MNFKYKTLMFVTLFIFCIGSVCATDPDEDNSLIVANLHEKNAKLEKTVNEQNTEIQKLKEDVNNLLFVTKCGLVKRTSVSEFDNIRNNGKICITLKEDDDVYKVICIPSWLTIR